MISAFLSAVALSGIDQGIILGFFLFTLGVGVWASRTAGQGAQDFFLGGRKMPWWLLGVSMVATTFATDTPNLVSGLVRENGVAGNWVWWGFLLSGMLTVFIFARLWHRSAVMTDIELYELRYAGKGAAFLRGFRALYLGLIFNVLVMGNVSLALVKFGEIILGVSGWQILLVAGIITLIYSSLGGLKGVIWTDFVQFILAMGGSIAAVVYLLNLDTVGGVQTVLQSELIGEKKNLFPDFTDASSWIPLLLVPLAVTWWSSYYPGSEPGGGGYIVQRMLSAKDEKNAVGATLFFNLAHYALRPWPWILIALASLILVPMKINRDYSTGHLRPVPATVEKIQNELRPDALEGMQRKLQAQLEALRHDEGSLENGKRLQMLITENLDSIEIKALAYLWQEGSLQADRAAYLPLEKQADVMARESLVHMYLANEVPLDKLGQDLGYPTMLKLLPKGLLGLVSASLIAAFMSTMSTQANLGASYLVNDFYARFLERDASAERLVMVGRVVTVLTLFMGAAVGLLLTDATQVFKMMLLIGAGTGPVYILRWFWWRVSALSELTAMVVSLVISLFVTFYLGKFIGADQVQAYSWQIMLIGALINTIIWVGVTLVTEPRSLTHLFRFCEKVKPEGRGWNFIYQEGKKNGYKLAEKAPPSDLIIGIFCALVGAGCIYTALFTMGYFLYGNQTLALYNLGIFLLCLLGLLSLRKRMNALT